MTNAEFQATVLKRFDRIDKRLDQINKRLGQLETKMIEAHGMLGKLAIGQNKLEQRLTELEDRDALMPA